MTRPVEEILEQARREGWPTSYIDAMANHHLCDNRWFEDSGSSGIDPEAGTAEPVRTRPLSDQRGRVHSSTFEGINMGNPTPEQLKQLRDGAQQLREQGKDTAGIDAVADLVSGVDPGPEQT